MQGSMAPPPASPLPEELVEEILLRFPPDEPACLFRASVFCKPWCRLIFGFCFRRRYRKFHRAAPMLGFLCTIFPSNGRDSEYARFMPTSAFCPPLTDVRSCSAIDARHGRVLLRCTREEDSWERRFVVWDPISDVRRKVPMNPRAPWCTWNWNAAVLCAAAAGTCNHLDCHGGSFLIVAVGSSPDRMLVISTYSSDSGTWSNTVFPHHPYHDGHNTHVYIGSSPCAHLGNALYFLSQSWKEVVRYDLCSHEVSVFGVPDKSDLYQPNALISTEDGGRLRYTMIYGFKLHMWLRKDDPQVDVGWTHNRVIDLETQLRSNAILNSPHVAGFADAIGVVFLRDEDMLFTFDLKTKSLKNVSKGEVIFEVLPYMRFYTPGASSSLTGNEVGCAKLEPISLMESDWGAGSVSMV